MSSFDCSGIVLASIVRCVHDRWVVQGCHSTCVRPCIVVGRCKVVIVPVSLQVVLDEHSQSKGYGFVHFETQESADMAIQKVNGMLLNDKKV